MKGKQFLSVVVGLALASSVVAQNVVVRGSGGWGANSPFNALYNHNTVVELEGKVIGVERSAPMQGMDVSVALLVKSSNGGTSTVDLGPAWYVDNLPTKVKMGDRVRVTGSKVFNKGRSMILARSVVRGNNVIYMRSEDGFPMWVAYRGHVTVAANTTQNTGSVQVAPNVTLLTGTVNDIIEIPNGQAGVPSTVIILTGNNGQNFNVDLGPVWFVGRQDFPINIGDFVTILPDGDPVRQLFRASQLRNGSNVLFLRNNFGQPVWLGFRGR
jgi:hypothetical protein